MKPLVRIVIVITALAATVGTQQKPVAATLSALQERNAATKTAPAVYVSDAEIQGILGSAPQMDRAARVVDAGKYRVGAFVIHRLADADQGCTNEHDTMKLDSTTEVWRVLDGAGTLVTGGTLMHPKPMTNDDPDLPLLGRGERGTPIVGGKSRRISKGDVVIVSAGVPHGFSAIEGSITLLVVRIDPTKTLPTK
jgi:mannose-6-phosphate isomerase-like protein (cupin superfamily)